MVLLDPDAGVEAEAPVRNWEERLMLEKDLQVFSARFGAVRKDM